MSTKTLARIYLTLVPFLTTFFAFATGHISYTIYLPIWVLNVLLMTWSAWVLGASNIFSKEPGQQQTAIAAFLLIVPWIFISVFFGMGAPPESAKDWVDTANEQQARFSILIFSGVLICLALSVLRMQLKKEGEDFYSTLGFTAILLALPLFLFAMVFWHSFALQAYRVHVDAGSNEDPAWYLPVRKMVWVFSMTEVSLTYFATAVFAVSLKKANWFSATSTRAYVIVSIFSIICILLYPVYPAAVKASGFPYYPFMIPAIAFLMLYFIGINLLRRLGK